MCVLEQQINLNVFYIRLKYYESLQRQYGRHGKRIEDERESEVDKMGNTTSKRPPLPNVYYSPSTGVTVGSSPSPTSPNSFQSEDDEELASVNTKPEGVRLRPRPIPPRHKSPSPSSDKDSAIGAGGSEMSQSLYSESSINRDSFYSSCTAESGFDDLGFLEELRSSKLSGSMKENFSPNSLKERSLQMLYRAHRGRDSGLNSIGKGGLETLSDCSSNHSGIISSCSTRSSCCSSDGTQVFKTNVDPLERKLSGNNILYERQYSSETQGTVYSTTCSENNYSAVNDYPPSSTYSSTKSSPFHPTPVRAGGKHSRASRLRLSDDESQRHTSPNREPLVYKDHFYIEDPSLEVTESIHSFNSSCGDDFNWEQQEKESEMEEGEGRLSLPPDLNQSLSDLHFRQSLMQRIQEWSSFAEEYNKSRSPTPNCSPIRFVRRSRSLDRHLSDSSVVAAESEIPSTKPLEIEPVTEKNLESLEYELHDIQGEFESITSKLHDLIEHGKPVPLSQTPMSSSYPAALSTRHSSTSRKPLPLCSESESSPSSQQVQAQSTPCISSTESRHGPIRKMKTKWQRVPGSICSDTSRSSRGSSLEYVWDLADYSPNNTASDRSRLDDHQRPWSANGGHCRGRLMSTDLCPVDAADCVLNIGSPVSVVEYGHQEWKGDTAKARTVREGYQQIPSRLKCERMCVIRGDNYCALRSTLFQMLANGLRVPSSWGIIGIMDRLHDHFDDPAIQMSSWSFANRLPGHCKDKLASISKCALSLYATMEEVCSLATRQEREKRTINLFNTSSTFDLELMEGLKVMMLLELVSLRQRMLDGEDVPIFVHLLFARDTSESVADFIRNHLNCVGDSGGLEQVEMCLLGYTLGVSIRVLRLSQFDQNDFECCFPDDLPPDTPQVVLMAEDDRHYNVPLP